MVKVFFGIKVIASNMHGMTETMGSEWGELKTPTFKNKQSKTYRLVFLDIPYYRN